MQEMDFSQRRQIVSNSLFMCPLAPYLKLKTFKDDDLDHILGKRKLVVVNNNMVYGNSLFERHTPLWQFNSTIPYIYLLYYTVFENMSGKWCIRVLYLFDFWYYQIKVDYFPIVLYTNAICMPRYNQETKKRQGLQEPLACVIELLVIPGFFSFNAVKFLQDYLDFQFLRFLNMWNVCEFLSFKMNKLQNVSFSQRTILSSLSS